MTFNVIHWFAKLQVVSGFYGRTSQKRKFSIAIIGLLACSKRDAAPPRAIAHAEVQAIPRDEIDYG
jgi:hypothetical protein